MTLLFTPALRAVQAASSGPLSVVPLRDGWAIAQTLAVIVLALAALAIFVLLLRVALELRSLDEGVRHLVGRMEERVDPVMERARVVAENAEYISHAVRTDVEKVGDAAERVRRSLDRASAQMEERVEEFNALIAVVQSEAESLFLDTASTVHGVKAGTRSLRGRRVAEPTPGQPSPEREDAGEEAEAQGAREVEEGTGAEGVEGVSPEKMAASSEAFPQSAESSSPGSGARDA